MNIKWCLYASAFALAAPLTANADDTPIEEIIVSASPLDRTSDDLTQPAIVLDKQALLLKSANSIGETLANEAGVSTTYFGPVAGRPVIRGQAGPRISVLEGGISTLDVADLSPDHAVPIEPLFADSIEVIRGPATLLYGSSAVGGVVNVVDNRVPLAPTDQAITGALELRADSVANQRTGALRVDGTLGSFGWHLDGFSRSTDDIDIAGFATADPNERPADEPEGTVINSSGEASGASAGASWFTENGFIGLSVSNYETTYGLPGPEEEEEGEEEEGPAIAPGPFIDLEQQRVDVRSRFDFDGPISTVRVNLGRNDYEHNEIEPNGEIGTRFENDAWELRVELTHAPIGQWRGALGTQITRRDFSAVGEEAFVPPVSTDSEGLFLLEELETGFGFIEFGARIEQLEHRPDAGIDGYDDTAISLAAGLKWELSDLHDLSFNVSRSERHAAASELYANGAHLATGLFEVGLLQQGSPVDLEVAQNIDVAWHHHDDATDWTASVFYNDINDYIFLDTSDTLEDGLPLSLYRQQDAQFFGFEAEMTHQFERGASPWSVRLLFDHVRGKTDSTDLPRIQPTRLGAKLNYEQPMWSASLGALYHAEQDDISSFQTDAFTMLDADFVVSVGSNSAIDWTLFAKATNLLDEDARRSTSFRAAFVPLPGRAIQLGLRASFN